MNIFSVVLFLDLSYYLRVDDLNIDCFEIGTFKFCEMNRLFEDIFQNSFVSGRREVRNYPLGRSLVIAEGKSTKKNAFCMRMHITHNILTIHKRSAPFPPSKQNFPFTYFEYFPFS